MLPEGEHVKSVSWCRSDFLCKLNATKSEKEKRAEVSEPKDPNLHINAFSSFASYRYAIPWLSIKMVSYHSVYVMAILQATLSLFIVNSKTTFVRVMVHKLCSFCHCQL